LLTLVACSPCGTNQRQKPLFFGAYKSFNNSDFISRVPLGALPTGGKYFINPLVLDRIVSNNIVVSGFVNFNSKNFFAGIIRVKTVLVICKSLPLGKSRSPLKEKIFIVHNYP